MAIFEVHQNTMLSYPSIINYIMHDGHVTSSRLGEMHEVLGLKVTFQTGELFYRPGLSRALGWAESLAVIGGAELGENVLKLVAPSLQWEYDSSAQYGLLLGTQIREIIKLLYAEPDTRRAIAVLSSRQDTGNIPKPCVSSYVFEQRNNFIDMVAFVRSWDLISGFIYDTMVMSMLNYVVAHSLGKIPGTIMAFAASGHVYTKDVEQGKLPTNFYDTTYFTIATDAIDKLESVMLRYDAYIGWALRNLKYAEDWARKRTPDGIIIKH